MKTSSEHSGRSVRNRRNRRSWPLWRSNRHCLVPPARASRRQCHPVVVETVRFTHNDVGVHDYEGSYGQPERALAS